MSGKIASFILSLVLIGWQVLDLVHGKTGVLTWALLGGFTLMGLFELGDIISSSHKTVTEGDQPTDHPAE